MGVSATKLTTLESALDRIAFLEEELAYQRKLNAQLQERIEKLERLIARDSGNSNKPPSSNAPWHKKAYRRREAGLGKAGAKPGHRGHFRKVSETIDEVITHRPHQCAGCAVVFCEGNYVLQSKVKKHQVAEIPEPKAIITEHRMMRYRCKGCDRVTSGSLPPEDKHSFGPRLTALVGSLSVQQRLSRRQIQTVLQEQYGLMLSTGGISSCIRRSAQACKPAVDEALKHLQEAPIKNADETSWFQKHSLHWLWVVCTKTLTVFLIDKRRNQEAAHRLLGATEKEHTGVLGADRYGGYAFWQKQGRQHCWAHLRREFVAMSERKQASALIGTKLLQLCDQAFALQAQIRACKIDKSRFDSAIKAVQRDCLHYLKLGKKTDDKDTVRICKSLLKDFRCLWVFIKDPVHIDCHNNESERSLRHAVITRKLTHGTQSEQGSKDIAILLSVHGSCRKQNRSVFHFLYDAINAHLNLKTPPSLLPA